MTSPSSSTHSGPSKMNGVATSSQGKMEQFTFTLGKLDAGMAILLGPNAHLLEFPSLLLPSSGPGERPLGPGSILKITVSRDVEAEIAAERSFSDLQHDILDLFSTSPKAPVLKMRSVTQTSAVLEWDKINCGSAGFRALEMYKKGQRWGRVGGDWGKREKREWKTGGLQVGEEYTFQLVLKTTAGTFPSKTIRVKTHTMDNLTGLLVHFGPLQPPSLLNQLRGCLREVGAKEVEAVGLETTHFVCTTPMIGGDSQGRGGSVSRDYAEAIKMNLPVVGPGWLLAVAAERKLIPISNYLLPAMPTDAPVADPIPFKRPEPLKRSSLTFPSSAPGSPIREEPMRSPSPETIARMSMTSVMAGAMPNGSRKSSVDEPTPERPRSREASLPVAKVQRPRSREASLPISESPRPKSPKPEADGKLDRGFKFPLSSNPTSPTSPSAPSTATTIPITAGVSESHAQAEPPSASTNGEIHVEPVTITSTTLSEEPESDPPVVSPKTESSNAQASTIDEAIANFHDAVKTPNNEPASPEEKSPVLETVHHVPLKESPLAEAAPIFEKAKDPAKESDPEQSPTMDEIDID